MSKEDGLEVKDERWRRAEALYHELMAFAPDQRAAALAEACPADSQLAAEVQSLLDQPDTAAGFLARPVQEVAARLISGTSPTLTGRRIGVFEVQELLGMGGMGEVYRARDTRLGRDVAIKVLPEAFAHDEGRLMRFNREAQGLAALNHPNIASIYGVEELPARSAATSGSLALVMELVEGEDLSARVARGPLPPDVALPIARQIAKALEGAHGQGIVHRDLKPANIKIRADGTVKVLDFGLAKVQPAPGGDMSAGRDESRAGDSSVSGTPGYMSPEQIRGQPVDWRSDLFAFGVVLYEMLSGQRAFAGTSGAETMRATLTGAPPDLKFISPATDQGLALAVARCLEKKPEDRFQSASDLGHALDGLSHGRGSGSMGRRQRLTRALALFAVLSVLALWRWPFEPPKHPSTQRQVTSDGRSLLADLSPDGESLAYIAGDDVERRLMLRGATGGDAVELFRAQALGVLRWSRQGDSIAFSAVGGPCSGPGTARNIVVLAKSRGIRSCIQGGGPFSLMWTADDRKLIAGSGGASWYWVVDLETEKVQQIEMGPSFNRQFVADLCPESGRLLFFVWDSDTRGIWSMNTDGKDRRRHTQDVDKAADARFAPGCRSFYYVAFGPNHSRLVRAHVLESGVDSAPEDIERNPSVVVESEASILSISANGRLAYARRSFDRAVWIADVDAGFETKRPISLRPLTDGANSEQPRYSPDGQRLVFAQKDGEMGQVVVASRDGRGREVVFSRKGAVVYPVWSPDAKQLAFQFDEGSGPKLQLLTLGGMSQPIGRAITSTFLEWAPGRDVLYRPADLDGYVALNSETHEEVPAVGGEPRAFHFAPRVSHRGDRVAILCNGRAASRGFGIAIGPLGGAHLPVIPGTVNTLPFGWSEDDQWIYAFNQSNRELLAVRVDGSRIRILGTLPSSSARGEVREEGGKLRLLISYPNDRSDIWIVDNFDGGRR